MIDSRHGDDSSDFDPPEPHSRYPEQATCKECNETKLASDMVNTYPNPGWNICEVCQSRLHPICACGCGAPATIIADVRWPGGVDCRAPWVDVEHARRDTLDLSARGQTPAIDVILDEEGLRAVTRLSIELAPCWCGVESMTCDHGYKYHTRLNWCPKHGGEGVSRWQ